MSAECLAMEHKVTASPLHLVEEINHRVINEYTQLISSISLAASASSNPQARKALAGAANQLHAFAEAHRALLPPVDEGPINLTNYVGRLCASFMKSTLADTGVRLTLDIDEIWTAADRAWRIGLIISELVRNAFRHGLSGRAGTIVIRLTQRSGRISCLVRDNGRAESNPKAGRGQRLIRALARELGACVDWQFTAAGSCARLKMPVVGG